MKILVTGATGFIGSHLLPQLLQNQHEVIAAIRHPDSLSKLSVKVPSVCVGEIDGTTDWQPALSKIEVVIHLAGRAHILDEKVADPEAEFNKVNITGTENLAKQSLAAGVKQLIFISSIGAVATLSDRTLTEATIPSPDTPYGRSKLAAESTLKKLTKNKAMDWTILRPTLVYGEGNPGNMANLVKLIELKLPLPLGSIKNRRSFLYVGNLVDAIAKCINNSKAKNQLFLVSDQEQISTPQLIQQIANSLDSKVRLIPFPLNVLQLFARGADKVANVLGRSSPISSNAVNKLSGSLAVDNSYICNSLNWQPPYTLEQGLKKGLIVRSR